jgi:hypothetical protein
MDDNQKKFIPQLAIDTEFFIVHFLSILVRCKTKAQSEQCSPTAHLAIKWLMANYCMRWRGVFIGLSQDGGRAGFSLKKTLHLSL